MPFVFWNASEVSVDNFHIKNPQLWSLNIMNGKNMRFNNIYVNATAVDAPYGTNWVQNTDGFGKCSYLIQSGFIIDNYQIQWM
jgi:polygalacturonase